MFAPGIAPVNMNHASKNRLTCRSLHLFDGARLFERIARTVCRAGCLPRKELYESWEVARRIRRLFRGGRVVDLACGHGLLAHILLVLDNTSPTALAVDRRLPPSAGKMADVFQSEWPRLLNRLHFQQTDLVDIPLRADDLVVASHACGPLTDLVLERATSAGARVAVLPCCHDLKTGEQGGLGGWLEGPLAMDTMRAFFLKERGYRIHTQRIPQEITPKNRLLIAEPQPFPGC